MTAPYDVALAGLMHDFGDQWQIAFEQDVNAWTALKRPPDGRHIRYLVAHEADALRRKIEDCSEDDEHPFGGGASLFDPPRL